MGTIVELLMMYLVFVFSTTCHEAAHAFVAYRGGDHTAYSHGHVTLDPMPHIARSPVGMVLVPILSFLTGGYMLGWASVPYDPHWGARHPLRAALMSLSGPLANFSLALIAILALRALIAAGVFTLGGEGARVGFVNLAEGVAVSSPLGAVAFLLSNLFLLNLLLGLFNLVPLPPLDGAGVAEGLSPRKMGSLYARLREIPAFELLGLIVASQLFGHLMGPISGVIRFALGA